MPERPQPEETSQVARFFKEISEPMRERAELRIEIRTAWPVWMRDRLYPKGNAPQSWQFHAPREWFHLCELQEAAEFALSCAGKQEVYFGVMPRTGRNGRASDVPFVSALWCDIDGGIDGVKGARALIAKADIPPPNFQVVSGGGIHAYWALNEAVALPDEETRQTVKNVLKRLCRMIGGETSGAHADPSRTDLSSILRAPNTFNRKREEEPRRVFIETAQHGERRSLLFWRSSLPPLPLPEMRARERTPSDGLSQPTERLRRWASSGYPEGTRHKRLTGAAVWLIRDVRITPAEAEELLLIKAAASHGARRIEDEEIRSILRWASR